jgi:hypothetical protein
MIQKDIKTVVVLGMHRSGTSMIAGILHKLGVDMGEDLIGASLHNPLGHYENIDFINLNKFIFRKAQGTDFSPPPRKNILKLENHFRDKIKDLIDKSQSYMWGWKDPRTCITIPLFYPHLDNPYFVICIRDKDQVVKSLKKRNPLLSQELATTAYKRYNEDIKKFLDNNPETKSLKLYYSKILKDPKPEIQKLIDFLDISVSSDTYTKINNFIQKPSEKKKLSYKLNAIPAYPKTIIDFLKMVLRRISNIFDQT